MRYAKNQRGWEQSDQGEGRSAKDDEGILSTERPAICEGRGLVEKNNEGVLRYELCIQGRR